MDMEEAKKAGRFVLTFAAAYITILFLSGILLPLQAIEALVANAVMLVLSLFGFSGKIVLQEPVLMQFSNGVVAQISELCTGKTETLIIMAAILASWGISWKKRLAGALAGVAVAFAFNIARIAITVAVISAGGDLQLVEFTHNILFRLTLFAVIAGFYAVWFLWATGQRKTL